MPSVIVRFNNSSWVTHDKGIKHVLGGPQNLHSVLGKPHIVQLSLSGPSSNDTIQWHYLAGYCAITLSRSLEGLNFTILWATTYPTISRLPSLVRKLMGDHWRRPQAVMVFDVKAPLLCHDCP